jgi:hypothetical protein
MVSMNQTKRWFLGNCGPREVMQYTSKHVVGVVAREVMQYAREQGCDGSHLYFVYRMVQVLYDYLFMV